MTLRKKLTKVLLSAVLFVVACLAFLGGLTACNKGSSAPAVTVTLNSETLTLYVHQNATLEATVKNSTETVEWETSDVSVATVDDGFVVAVGAGDCTVTASVGNVQAECAVTVLESYAAPIMAVDHTVVGLDVNDEKSVSATVTYIGDPVSNVAYMWSIADGESQAVVSVTAEENGTALLKATGYGTTKVEVSATVFGIALKKTISVSVHSTDVTFESDDLGLTEGGMLATLTLLETDKNHTVTPEIDVYKNGTLVANAEITDFTVADPTIAAYNNGTLKALKVGETELVGTYEGNVCVIKIVVERAKVETDVFLPISVGGDTGEVSLTVPVALDGAVIEVTWQGNTVQHTENDGVLSLVKADLPSTISEMKETEETATLVLITEKAEYSLYSPVYSAYITTSEELDAARQLPNGYIVLGKDITYTGAWDYVWDKTNWKGVTFTGEFDGKGHFISGVNAKDTQRAMWENFNGTIKNVAFVDAHVFNSGNLISRSSSGAETYENIYVHALTAGAKTSTNGSWNRGGLFEGWYSYNQKMSNVYIQIDSTLTDSFTFMNGIGFQYGAQLRGVYAVGENVSLVDTVEGEPTSRDQYASYVSRTAMAQAEIDFGTWDNSVWTTDEDGLPIFKSVYAVNTKRVNVEMYNVATSATQTFDLSDYANGTIQEVEYNYNAIEYTGTLSALTLNKNDLYGGVYGEKKVWVRYADESGSLHNLILNVYVVTQELNNADELDAARLAYTSVTDQWNVINANYYVLGNDIDYTGRTTWIYDNDVDNDGVVENVYFHGVFDGAGYNIDGVTAKGWDGAMFYSIGGTIKNVSFTNVTLGKKASLFNEHQNGNAARFENIYIHCTSVESTALEGGTKQYTGFFSLEATDWNNYFKNIYIEIDENKTTDDTPVYVFRYAGKRNINGMYTVGAGVQECLRADDWGEGVYAGGVYETRGDLTGVDFSGWDDTIWTTDADGLPIFVNLANK